MIQHNIGVPSGLKKTSNCWTTQKMVSNNPFFIPFHHLKKKKDISLDLKSQSISQESLVYKMGFIKDYICII